MKFRAAAGKTLPYLPLLILGAAILWDWAMTFDSRRHVDIVTFMYMGQRLVEGMLLWTRELEENKLPVVQFLFYLPALLESFSVWRLMSMALCLCGAWAVYALLRDIFRADGLGHHAGLWGAVFMLYLFSVPYEGIGFINPPAASLLLCALAMLRRFCKRGGRVVFLTACFCASVAVGIRPYYLLLTAIMPLWAALHGRMRVFLLWNAGCCLFGATVNALPYLVIGDLEALLAGLSFASQVGAHSMDDMLASYGKAYRWMDLPGLLLLLGWMAWLPLCLLLLLAPRRWSARFRRLSHFRAAAPDLCFLTFIAPLSVCLMFATHHFNPHYPQLLAPFFAMGAASLGTLAATAGRGWLPRTLAPWMPGALGAALALALLSQSGLDTKPDPDPWKERKAADLSALLRDLGMEQEAWLVPHNIFVHWKLRQPRHGFPNNIRTKMLGDGNWTVKPLPPRYRFPLSVQEYCEKLDAEGPPLVVFEFVRYNSGLPLECEWREYTMHDVSGDADPYPTIQHYYLRRD